MSEVKILRKLTDEEIDNLSIDELHEMMEAYNEKIPYENTIQSLLEDNDIKYDDLPSFVLEYNAGRCNTASRTKNQIYLSRPSSKWKDNIVINLNKDAEVPYFTEQTGDDKFVHEVAYNHEGWLIYRA